MRKRVESLLVVAVLGIVGTAGAVGAGCVSNPAAGPSGGVDGSVSFDSGAPPLEDGGSHPTDATSPPADVAAADVAAVDASGAVDATDSATPQAFVRFAWFVGGQAPGGGVVVGGGIAPNVADGGAGGYDVCVAPHGTGAWVGPLLAGSALSAGLQPFDVTSYFPVAPGQYDARIVVAGSGTCNLPDAGAPGGEDGGDEGGAIDAGGPSSDFTSLPSIAAGAALSVVLVNPSATTSIADVFTFSDDTTTSTGKAKIRFINVSESDVTEAADAGADGGDAGTITVGGAFGLGGGVAYSTLFANVTSQQGIDPTTANGYVEVAPLAGIDSTLTPGASPTEQLASDALNLNAGGILTAFYTTDATGVTVYAPSAANAVLVWCYDGQPSAASPALTRCFSANQPTDSAASATRFGNFLADSTAQAADVCVKYHSYGAYAGPLVAQAGTPTGIPVDSLSSYFPLHGGYSFDARFVAGGSADCATSLADVTFTSYSEPGGGGYTSALLTGYTTVPDDAGAVPPYDAGPPFDAGDDAGDAGPQPVSSGLTSLAKTVVVIEDEAYITAAVPGIRLVHLDAAHPQPMALSVSGGGALQWSLTDVPYGGFSTQPPPIDPYGYATTTTGALSLQIDATTWDSFTMIDDQESLFAFDSPTGIQLLACNDYFEDYPQTALGLYSDCCNVNAPGCASGVVGVGSSSGAQMPMREPQRHGRPR